MIIYASEATSSQNSKKINKTKMIDYRPKRTYIKNPDTRWHIFALCLILAFGIYLLSGLSKAEILHCIATTTPAQRNICQQ